MRRWFIDERLADTVTLSGPDAYHLGHVMRARTGQHCVIVDTERQVAEMEITGFTADTVTLRCVTRLQADTESPIDLVLAMCLPKGDKMDFIVQKAVELGASAIQPLKSANCVVKYDDKKAAARQLKWQRIADEAAKQCGRTLLPIVEPVLDLETWLKNLIVDDDTAAFFCYENEQKRAVADYLHEIAAHRYLVLVGPEGGFAPVEATRAAAAGLRSVTLGPRILRTETAALAALTIVQYARGDMGRCVSAVKN